MGDQGSQQGAEELEPQQTVDQHQLDEPNGESIQANDGSDLFDWELYGNDTARDYVGDNTNFPVGDSNQGFNTYIPNINNAPRQTDAQVQDQNPWRNPNMDQDQPAHHNKLVLPAMEPELPETVNPRLRAPQDNKSAAVMTSRVSSPPIGFAVDNSPAQDNNSLPLGGVMSNPAASHKLFPTAGLTNPVGSSPGSRADTPLKASCNRRKEKTGPAEPTSKSPSKKSPLKETQSRKRKATSSPQNQAQNLVQPNDNNGNNDSTGNLFVQDQRSAAVRFSMSPHGLPDPFSDVPEGPLPASVNNSPVPTPPGATASPSERRERLKNTLAEYHVDRMTAWKALPGSTHIEFFKELVRADDRGEELEDWELEFLTYSTEEDRTIVYREIALEAEKKVQMLEERHSRLRQRFEDSKQGNHQLRQWIFALKRTVEKKEVSRQRMVSRIADLERSHLVLNQGLDERVHLLNTKVDRKVNELEEAIQKLNMGDQGLSEEEDDRPEL